MGETGRPTEAQRKVLLAMTLGKSPRTHRPAETLRAMARRGWVVWHEGAYRLTEAGRKAAQAIGRGEP